MRHIIITAIALAGFGVASVASAQDAPAEEATTVVTPTRGPLLEDIRVSLLTDTHYVRTQSWYNLHDAPLREEHNVPGGGLSVVLNLRGGVYAGLEMTGANVDAEVLSGDYFEYQQNTYALRGGYAYELTPWLDGYGTATLGAVRHDLALDFSGDALEDRTWGGTAAAAWGVRAHYQFPLVELGIAADYGYRYTSSASFDDATFDESEASPIDLGTLDLRGTEFRVLFSAAIPLQRTRPAPPARPEPAALDTPREEQVEEEPEPIVGPSQRAVEPIGVSTPPNLQQPGAPVEGAQTPEGPDTSDMVPR